MSRRVRTAYHDPSLSEADTRAKLINPVLYARGWSEEMIRREEMAETIGSLVSCVATNYNKNNFLQ